MAFDYKFMFFVVLMLKPVNFGCYAVVVGFEKDDIDIEGGGIDMEQGRFTTVIYLCLFFHLLAEAGYEC